MSTINQQTINTKSASYLKDILASLKVIEKEVKATAKRANKNYGHIGNLASVKENLDEIKQFLNI